jgi:hypothetical protein
VWYVGRRGFKGSVYEGGIRMPAIVRWPGRVQAGSTTGELAATYDIFTTMLTMAAVPLPSDRIIDGKDLSPIIFVRSAVSRAASTSILSSCALTRRAAMDLQGTGKSQHECIFNPVDRPVPAATADRFRCLAARSRPLKISCSG